MAQLVTYPGQGANAIGIEKEQIDDARGGRFFAKLPCARGKSGCHKCESFAGLVESESDVKL